MPLNFHRHQLPLFDWGKVLLGCDKSADYIDGNLLFCGLVYRSPYIFKVL